MIKYRYIGVLNDENIECHDCGAKHGINYARISNGSAVLVCNKCAKEDISLSLAWFNEKKRREKKKRLK